MNCIETAPPIISEPTLLEAIQEVGGCILQHWVAFLVIFLFVIGAVFSFFVFVYKNRSEELKSKESNLDKREKELSTKEQKLKEDIKEIKSPEYQAYLLSKGIYRKNLSDVDMFNTKKARVKEHS